MPNGKGRLSNLIRRLWQGKPTGRISFPAKGGVSTEDLMKFMLKAQQKPSFGRRLAGRSALIGIPTLGTYAGLKMMGAKPVSALKDLASSLKTVATPEFAAGIQESTKGLTAGKEYLGSATDLVQRLTDAMQTTKQFMKPITPYLPYTTGGSLIGGAALGIPALIRGMTADEDDELGWMARNPGMASLFGSALGAAGGGLYKYMQPKAAAYDIGQTLAQAG